jgi:hypothetical protein
MPYRKPHLTPFVTTDPEKVRRLIRAAMKDAKCKRSDAARILDASAATLANWIDILDMEDELQRLEIQAKKEGWHHGDVGGRPKGSTKHATG